MTLIIAGGCGGGAGPLPGPAGADRQYLEQLSRETWNWLDAHRSPSTGFPWDTQQPGGMTNTTNIGLYLAALPVAVEFGYLDRDTASARAAHIVASLGRLEHRHGFLPNWVPVDLSGDTRIPEGVCAISDFNKLICGLILARNAFPEMAPAATALIDRVDWTRIRDAGGGLCYGIDLRADRPIGNGRIWIASDVRGAVFAAICRGVVPPEYWDRLDRPRVSAHGLTFFGPGYEWGGLFMQAMDAIFLEERGTEMGRSIADLAWHQLRSARSFDRSLWGWSNCNIPGSGYTEGGFLPFDIVTPHASALVLDYYPRHALANLRALEARGMREPLAAGDPPWGFRDSYNQRWDAPASLTAGRGPAGRGPVDGRDKRFLSLDQAMLFLSVANHLTDGIVRRLYAADPLVARGIQLLGARLQADSTAAAVYAGRDGSEPEPFPGAANDVAPHAADSSAGVIAAAAAARNASDSIVRFAWQGESGPAAWVNAMGGASATLKRSADHLEVTYTFAPDGGGEVDLEITLPSDLDIRLYPDLAIQLAGVASPDPAASAPAGTTATPGAKARFGGARVFLRDSTRQSQLVFTGDLAATPQWHLLPSHARSGIFAAPDSVRTITLKLWHRPWFFSDRRTEAISGKLILRAVEFRRAAA